MILTSSRYAQLIISWCLLFTVTCVYLIISIRNIKSGEVVANVCPVQEKFEGKTGIGCSQMDEDIREYLDFTAQTMKGVHYARRGDLNWILDLPGLSQECRKLVTDSAISKRFNSQSFQDWVAIAYFFRNKKKGFYIDIGANDPRYLSTTWFFDVCLGWDGICIEPFEGHFPNWEKSARKCKLLRMGIDDTKGTAEFYVGGSGIHRVHAGERKKKVVIDVDTVNGILRENNVKHIDFASIDPDGVEIEAVKYFDLREFNTKVIAMEVQRHFLGPKEDTIMGIFSEQSYLHLWFVAGLDRFFIQGPRFVMNTKWLVPEDTEE